MSHGLAACLLIGALLTVTTATAEDLPVDLELVLAVDVSASIDAEEARQQREGYVAAIADPAVIEAIRANFHQRIALAYIEWASADYQRLLIDWTVIEDAASADEFAAALAAAPVFSARWTSISGAIDFIVPLFDGNGYAGERQVIDISGDGPNNWGPPITLARDRAVARGIVINGLPILNDRRQPFALPTPIELALDQYYTEYVIGGPGSFVIPVLNIEDFRIAILNKLIREIAAAPTQPVDLTGTARCRRNVEQADQLPARGYQLSASRHQADECCRIGPGYLIAPRLNPAPPASPAPCPRSRPASSCVRRSRPRSSRPTGGRLRLNLPWSCPSSGARRQWKSSRPDGASGYEELAF